MACGDHLDVDEDGTVSLFTRADPDDDWQQVRLGHVEDGGDDCPPELEKAWAVLLKDWRYEQRHALASHAEWQADYWSSRGF